LAVVGSSDGPVEFVVDARELGARVSVAPVPAGQGLERLEAVPEAGQCLQWPEDRFGCRCGQREGGESDDEQDE
jgi:hypothetical protein